MKILYLASVRIPNEKASGLAIMRQCEGFSEIGNEVVLLRPHRRNHITEDAFSFYNIKKIFLVQTMPSVDFTSRLGIVGFSLTLLSQMVCALLLLVTRYRHFEVVYSRDPWLLLPIVFFTSGRVVVLEAHKTYQNGVMSLVTRRVALLVCITNKLKETLAKLAERDDILVEPSGVDLAQFTDLPPVDQVRQELGLPRDKKIVGYTGKYTTMGEEKGVSELIAAFARVHEHNKNTHLLLVGIEDAEREMVSAVCQKVGLGASDVTVLSLIQSKFAQYVHAADVLVMNYPDTEHYRDYMSPTKLFAYMGSGKIIVTSDLPSVREIVDESMVLFARPGDIDSLANSITEAVSGGPRFKEMAPTAQGHVREFSWRKRASRISSTISEKFLP